jgi:phosphoribosylformimino-5-aminoimidazole carboxamide ribotide isomerase
VIVIPAVDLRDGRCVRLREGRRDRETVFGEDPVAGAALASLGAWLHVDLDGALPASRGRPRSAKIVAAVAPVPVEMAGAAISRRWQRR